ncbi:hypothetical protein I7I51_09089 [Histoplasma capsulatum]|uniref:Uncharacterized protein n=1 Tax=Ajellomyces capsulatus TaxID=5037 RepID=A0A8A1M4I9_AJECA|nr:hypothetical protein I7I51_09089 [Histoplasma capsulatum]
MFLGSTMALKLLGLLSGEISSHITFPQLRLKDIARPLCHCPFYSGSPYWQSKKQVAAGAAGSTCPGLPLSKRFLAIESFWDPHKRHRMKQMSAFRGFLYKHCAGRSDLESRRGFRDLQQTPTHLSSLPATREPPQPSTPKLLNLIGSTSTEATGKGDGMGWGYGHWSYLRRYHFFLTKGESKIGLTRVFEDLLHETWASLGLSDAYLLYDDRDGDRRHTQHPLQNPASNRLILVSGESSRHPRSYAKHPCFLCKSTVGLEEYRKKCFLEAATDDYWTSKEQSIRVMDCDISVVSTKEMTPDDRVRLVYQTTQSPDINTKHPRVSVYEFRSPQCSRCYWQLIKLLIPHSRKDIYLTGLNTGGGKRSSFCKTPAAEN